MWTVIICIRNIIRHELDVRLTVEERQRRWHRNARVRYEQAHTPDSIGRFGGRLSASALRRFDALERS